MMQETSFNRIITALKAQGKRVEIKRTDCEAIAQCPAHEDKNPSLHITYETGENAKTLVHCFAECQVEDILQSLQLKESDCYDQPLEKHSTSTFHNNNREHGVRDYAKTLQGNDRNHIALANVWDPIGVYEMPKKASSTKWDADPNNEKLLQRLQWKERDGSNQCPVCKRSILHVTPIIVPEIQGTRGNSFLLVACPNCSGKQLADYFKEKEDPAYNRMEYNDTSLCVHETIRPIIFDYGDMQVLRGIKNGKKSIIQKNADGKQGATKRKQPVYNLDIASGLAQEQKVIFFVEGEKDACAMLSVGYPAISAKGGGNSVRANLDLEQTIPKLKGLHLVCVCDKDETGSIWREQIYELFSPYVNKQGILSLTFIQGIGKVHDAGDAVALNSFQFERLQRKQVETNEQNPTNSSTDSSITKLGGKEEPTDENPIGEDFWNQTEYLKTIRDVARDCMASPWAVLGCVLALTQQLLPPHIVIPKIVGAQYGSLNTFVAVLGASGDGKGKAEGVARRLIPYTLDAIITKPSSGESFASLFAQWETVEDENGKSHLVLKCTRFRALLDIPEISWLAGTSSRNGSTIKGELASSFVGEKLGGDCKNKTNTITAPQHGYRLNMICGVQYATAHILFDMSDIGIPQRTLFVDTLDFYMRDPDKEELNTHPVITSLIDIEYFPKDIPDTAAFYESGVLPSDFPFEVMQFPEIVWETTRRITYARNEQKKRGEDDGDNLDGHLNFLRIKIAATLPWLDRTRENHMIVTEDDWRIAGQIIQYSNYVREYAQRRNEEYKVREHSRRELDRKKSKVHADQDYEKTLNITMDKIMAFMRNDKHKGHIVQGRDIKNGITKNYKEHVEEALKMLESTGTLQCVKKGVSVTASTWKEPVR